MNIYHYYGSMEKKNPIFVVIKGYPKGYKLPPDELAENYMMDYMLENNISAVVLVNTASSNGTLLFHYEKP